MAAGAAGALGLGAVKGAADLESYRLTLNTVMKDEKAAAELMKWANNYANITPFDTQEVVEATVKLQSYGLTAKEVLPKVGDMASVMNKDIIDAVEAVADAQNGELERLKEFGISKQQIIDQGNKIMRGKEIVNNKGQIVDQENFNKALFSLMDERFRGGTERQANSFKGLMSTLKGTFQTTLTSMAGISADGTIKIGGPFDRLKTTLKGVQTKIDELAADGTLERWGKNVSDAITAVFNAADNLWKKIGPVLTDIRNWINNDAIPAAESFKQNFVKAFDDSKGSLENFNKIVNDAKDFTQQLWNILNNFTPESGTAVGKFFGIVAKNLDRVAWAADNVYKQIKPVLDAIEFISSFGKNKNNVLPPAKNTNPAMGAAAEGVDNWQGGPILVGEKGPEILNLPRGSQVIPNNKIAGNTYNLYNTNTKNLTTREMQQMFRRMEMLANV